MKRLSTLVVRLGMLRGTWLVYALVGVVVSGTTLNVRVEARSMQNAPPARVETPGEPQADDVVAPEQAQREVYTYDAERRPDPFVSLLTLGANRGPLNERPAGLAGLTVNDVSLRGLVFSGGAYLAVMQAPDNRTYILRGEEVLFDGVVKNVSAEGITFLQQVNDPLSMVREREVLRTLHGQEERR